MATSLFMFAVTAALLGGCGERFVQPIPYVVPLMPRTGVAPEFPILRKTGHRCHIGQNGLPFLIHGDAAWSLIVQLSREDAIRYLQDRKERGFNTLLVNLLEHHFARHPPRNLKGDLPFLHGNDFSSPNEAYFSHADWILQQAAERGFLVLLAPSYLGFDGGVQGWYEDMQKAGPDRMRNYGRYLGMRYGLMRNIIWLHGGDFDPPDRAAMLALMEGLREMSPTALHSFHGARGTAARRFLEKDASWLDLNTVYTDEKSVAASSRAEYSASPMPFIFIEGQYENAGADDRRVRTQAFQAMLSGACGQLMGNKPIWMFDETWESALDSPAARSMTRFRQLMERFQWSTFRPAPPEFLVDGAGEGSERAVAAFSGDYRRALLYVPTFRTFAVDLSVSSMSRVLGWWIDPANGHESRISEAVLGPGGRKRFVTPAKNSGGQGDWLLLLESE